MIEFYSLILLLSLTIACLIVSRTLIHYFQLESYQFPGYFRTLLRRCPYALLPGLVLNILWAGGAALLVVLFPGASAWVLSFCESAILLAGAWMIIRLLKTRKEKKPLKYTPRIKRLYLVSGIVFFLILLLSVLYGSRGNGSETRPGPGFVICVSFPFFLPVWVALGGLIAWPFEKLISELYFRDAQRILKSRPDLIKIGITGSWGKTSVKYILGTLLEEKYHTCITPASFNTPMGVTKVIRSQLEPGHRVFVAEMGARHVGDIREMCRLVHPEYGVLTSVGPQHLDTFKTLDRVKKTKYELIDALPPEGAAFFADDNGICRELYQKTQIRKWISGMEPYQTDVWAEEIKIDRNGSSFQLCRKDGSRIFCETRLLGKLNIRNILQAASVCFELGLSDQQIMRGIRKLKPVEHRLQLIQHPNGVSVIDDAFNSNIRGAEQAFSVLKALPARRIVVTPGMVELGSQESALNHELGKKLAECCDIAVLIGTKHSRPIYEGLREMHFPEDTIHTFSGLQEAQKWLQTHTVPGDTILFENDLPDNYSEE